MRFILFLILQVIILKKKIAKGVIQKLKFFIREDLDRVVELFAIIDENGKKSKMLRERIYHSKEEAYKAAALITEIKNDGEWSFESMKELITSMSAGIANQIEHDIEVIFGEQIIIEVDNGVLIEEKAEYLGEHFAWTLINSNKLTVLGGE